MSVFLFLHNVAMFVGPLMKYDINQSSNRSVQWSIVLIFYVFFSKKRSCVRVCVGGVGDRSVLLLVVFVY